MPTHCLSWIQIDTFGRFTVKCEHLKMTVKLIVPTTLKKQVCNKARRFSTLGLKKCFYAWELLMTKVNQKKGLILFGNVIVLAHTLSVVTKCLIQMNIFRSVLLAFWILTNSTSHGYTLFTLETLGVIDSTQCQIRVRAEQATAQGFTIH